MFGEEENASTLPSWLNLDTWNKWVAYRKDIKKKLTPRSIEMQLKELEKDIPNHVAIIERLIMNGWTGLFPLKGEAKKVEVYKNNETPQEKKDKFNKINSKVIR